MKVRMCDCEKMQMSESLYVLMCKCTNVWIYESGCTNVRICECMNVWMY